MWESADRVQKNEAGEYRALIGGEWVPVAKAQKNAQGQYRVERFEQPAAPKPEVVQQRNPDIIERGLRATALAGRAATTGLTGLPALAAQGLAWPVNKLTGTDMQPLAAWQWLLDKMYGVAPETPTERVTGDIIGGMAGAGAMARGSQIVADQAKKLATKYIAGTMAAKPAMQAVSGATGGAGAGMARESGAGPTVQLLAGLAAATAPSLAISGVQVASKLPMRILSPILPGGAKRGASQIMQEALREGRPLNTVADGDDLARNIDDVVAALRNAPDDYDAGMAVAKTWKNPVFTALKQVSKGDRPSAYKDVDDALVAKETKIVNKYARGSSAEESIASQEKMRANLEYALGPKREAELGAAGQAGRTMSKLGPRLTQKEQSRIAALQNRGVMQTESAQQGQLAQGQRATDPQLIRNPPQGMERNAPVGYPTNADRFGNPTARNTPAITQPTGAPKGAYPVEGQPRIPPRYTLNADRAKELSGAADDMAAIARQRQIEKEFIERQIGSLESHGLKPLTVDPIVGKIEAQLASKTTQVNEVMSKALKIVAEKFRIAGQGGEVDPYALYEIRKTGINQVFDELVASGQLNKTQAAAAIKQLRPMIDDAIENAGGSEWKSYITKYHKGLEAIDRVKFFENARQMYNSDPKGFAELMRGEKPEVINDFLAGKFNISDAITKNDKRLASFQNIADRIETSAMEKDLIDRGATKLTEILKAKANPDNPTQGLLVRQVTFTNNIIRILEGKGLKASEALISDLFLPKNRQALIEVLLAAKPNTRALLIKEMAKEGIKLPGATVGALLAKPSETE